MDTPSPLELSFVDIACHGIDPDDRAVEGLADPLVDLLCHTSAVARLPAHLALAQRDLPAMIGDGILVGYPDISIGGGPTVLGGGAPVGSSQARGSFLKATGRVITGSSQLPITFAVGAIPPSLPSGRTVTARIFVGDELNVPAIADVPACSPLDYMTCQGPISHTDLPQKLGKTPTSQRRLSRMHRPGHATKTCQGTRIR